MFEFIRAHQLNIMISLSSICGIITLFVIISKAMPKTRKTAMILTEGGSMLLLMFDRFAYIYRGDVSSPGWWMVRISNFGVFAVAPIIIFGFNLYLSDLLSEESGIKKLPRRMKVVNILALIGEILIILNVFTGLYYTFDSTNHYQRSSGFIIAFAIPLISLIIMLSVIIQYGSGIRPKMRIPLLLFTTLPVIAAVIQVFAYGISLINITMVGTDIIMYVFVVLDMDAAKEAKEEAESENRAKTAFLANMSHEIRTPINAVLGMNEMILRECEDEEILEYSSNIRTAGNTLLSLINDILDFSKIGAGKMEIVPVNYDISSVINDLVNMISTRAEEKGLELRLNMDETLPKILNGDEIRIKQIITNLLTNAVKYTEKGSVTFSMGYEKDKDDPDAVFLIVSVKDTGIGIKEEDLDRLFSKFERLDEEHNRNIEGTGLGMSITLNLLKMMGSNLELESSYGEGSDFHFRLRQKVVKWEPLGDYEAAYRALLHNKKKYREKFRAPSARLLIIDDTPMNITVFKNLLKKTEVKIDTAESGAEGLKLAYERSYDIIFIDHMMPGKDGIETLQDLKRENKHPNRDTPCICLTANAISGVKEEYIAAGFDDYLSKPIDTEKLEDMIREYLPDEKIVIVDKEASAGAEDGRDDDIPEGLLPLSECGIDVRTGIKNNGGLDDYLPVVEIFRGSLDARCDEIEGYYNEDDLENYSIKVHAVKSSARIIGAESLGQEAQMLEDAGKSGDRDYISRHHAPFMAGLKELKTGLDKVFPDSAGQKKKLLQVDEYMLEAVYEEMGDAAKAEDKDRLKTAFGEMEDYILPEEEEELWLELKKAYTSGDYGKMTGLLDNRVK